MMTFSEFVKNDALEKTVVSNSDNYRQKFIKIIEKAGVSDSDIQDEEALKKTIETKEVHYFSRSRNEIWHKGKTSGFVQKVKSIRIDDDQDSIWVAVDIGDGASCHVGYKSCFYRSIDSDSKNNDATLKFEEKEKKFDPEKVYKGMPNPTKLWVQIKRMF